MKRVLAAFLFLIAYSSGTQAQVSKCSDANSKLICIIPNQLKLDTSNGQNLAFLNGLTGAIGTVVSDLPLASPASGVIYTTDPKLNIDVPSNETLGPILVQRAETIGRHKIFVGFTFQYFRFTDIDGISIKQLPIFLTAPSRNVFTASNNRLDLSASQATGYFTFGLTSRIDVSVAVPIVDINERFTTSGTEYPGPGITGLPTSVNKTSPSSATGIGDVTLAVKARVWHPKHGGLSVGADLRLPSGDANNFLGAGTVGFRPFATATYGGRISPHANVAFELNGDSVLVGKPSGGEGHLPYRLIYSGGADWGIRNWVTLSADVLAQHVYDSDRLRINPDNAIPNPNVTFPSIAPYSGSYNRTDGSIGLKIKPVANLIITGNVLVKLDQGGLRTRIVPLGGVSYTF